MVSASLDRLAPIAGARAAATVAVRFGLVDGAAARAPLPAAGDAPTLIAGAPLDPPGRLVLRDVHRAGGHRFMPDAAPS